ncbi:unnamed protein product [Caenorhabditis auriculariae]|uniref:Uncharacterized protein n=1 Tax=Caenorhabditis auriculariae TaxID=2777116 RepID=A0A8S1HAP1_9PELO|nr:unnamed protein product [Caenorhabditis auriculariae]
MAHSLLGMVDILKTGGFFACYVNIHIVCDEICADVDGKTIIIDFAIPFREGYQRENVCQLVREGTPAPVDTLVNGVANRELRKVVEACSSDERIKIARTAIDK